MSRGFNDHVMTYIDEKHLGLSRHSISKRQSWLTGQAIQVVPSRPMTQHATALISLIVTRSGEVVLLCMPDAMNSPRILVQTQSLV